MSKLVVSEQTAGWYAVYTKPRWEKKVAEGLQKKGIEHYCPLNRVVRQWSDRKKTIMEPLFSSYVFVHVAEDRKWQVKEVEGVLNYVYWLGKPALIPNEDIERIKRFLNEHEQVQVTSGTFKINDKVRIISGPFMNAEAQVVALKGNRVSVEIPSMAISLHATVKTTALEMI
jgi:transcription antitermination factor NusG